MPDCSTSAGVESWARTTQGDTLSAPAGFSAATKTFGTEFEQRLASFCARALGPRALLWGPEHGLGARAARALCYSPAYTIMGGTAQILRNVLGERVLGLPR